MRVLRIVARMNVGGPAYHVSLLSGRLRAMGYETLLVAGRLGPGEATFPDLAARYGATLREVDALGPELAPCRDVRAVLELVRLIRTFRPHIVHTHTAKAGAVGRVAARLALGSRPIVVHTYHGHVLTGYFGPVRSTVYRLLERGLGQLSDRLVAVSPATADDLVRMRVAPRRKFSVVPVGLDLERFVSVPAGAGADFRSEVGANEGECIALLVGRLVRIKRVDVALRAVAAARSKGVRVRLAVVGDGELRPSLERLAGALGLDDAVKFLGFRHDLDRIVEGADLALLTSDNEGTPVALIEASAGARPSIATDVGGVADVVTTQTGRRVPRGDVDGLASAIAELCGDPRTRAALGHAARAHVLARFSSGRLLADVDRLYRSLLEPAP